LTKSFLVQARRYATNSDLNLKGGILAWADQVDRSMQKY